MEYPGSKAGMGVWQRIINEIPPHSVYVEAFCGSGVVFRQKRLAPRSILVDREPGALALTCEAAGIALAGDEGPWRSSIAVEREGIYGTVQLVKGDAVAWLRAAELPPDAVVYCDPPYLLETRGGRRYYRHEMTFRHHCRLLRCLLGLSCRVLLSGYPSSLYASMLDDWRSIAYRVMTRGGIRQEVLWSNYPEPVELHDYRFLGQNFREREKVRRQQATWQRRLATMPRLRRLALLSVLGGSADLAAGRDGRPSWG